MKLSISTIGLVLEVIALAIIFIAILGGVFNVIILLIVILAIINYGIAIYHLKSEKPQVT
ncbi:MAG: hypothetical protein Q7R70_05875 [Candidatus Diapherotrites archaeon]|nr:hypothetical protein [Candidatus Diapherotrites archaeon]